MQHEWSLHAIAIFTSKRSSQNSLNSSNIVISPISLWLKLSHPASFDIFFHFPNPRYPTKGTQLMEIFIPFHTYDSMISYDSQILLDPEKNRPTQPSVYPRRMVLTNTSSGPNRFAAAWHNPPMAILSCLVAFQSETTKQRGGVLQEPCFWYTTNCVWRILYRNIRSNGWIRIWFLFQTTRWYRDPKSGTSGCTARWCCLVLVCFYTSVVEGGKNVETKHNQFGLSDDRVKERSTNVSGLLLLGTLAVWRCLCIWRLNKFQLVFGGLYMAYARRVSTHWNNLKDQPPLASRPCAVFSSHFWTTPLEL